jgi:hypothetical protein
MLNKDGILYTLVKSSTKKCCYIQCVMQLLGLGLNLLRYGVLLSAVNNGLLLYLDKILYNSFAKVNNVSAKCRVIPNVGKCAPRLTVMLLRQSI